MAKYLTLDIGNSSVKAALWVDGIMRGPTLWGVLSERDIERLCALADGELDCVAVCAVAPDAYGLGRLAASFSRRFIEVSSATPMPLDLRQYATIATLGPDRIAAMVGAMSLCPDSDLLVVDCGTAVTFDRVDAHGRFLGGNIAPGIGMRLRALHAFTARLPEAVTDPSVPLWGQSTIAAMQAGAFYGVAGEITYYRSQCPDDTELVLTGGRSSDLCQHLPFPVIADADLVLRGLKKIIEYNEDK